MPVDLGESQRLELAALGLADYPPVHVVDLVAVDVARVGVDLVEVEELAARVQVLVEEGGEDFLFG